MASKDTHGRGQASNVLSMTPGAPNGASRTRAFDRWFRYPAGFSPPALDAAIDAVGAECGDLLVDPFAGVATAGTAGRAMGLRYRGIEAHPIIAELANLKLKRPSSLGDTEALVTEAEELTAKVGSTPIAHEHELVRRCFDPDTLSKLTALRNLILDTESRWARHLKWALLGTLREAASVKVGWPHQRPNRPRVRQLISDPVQRFVDRAGWIADDLAAVETGIDHRVVAGDSRLRESWTRALGDEKPVGCVSSPPYLNNFDYADATRLELYFWRDVSTWAEMCAEVRDGMLIATTQQSSTKSAATAWRQLDRYPATRSALKPLASELTALRLERVGKRGKEYDRVLPAYFVGIARVLGQLHHHLAAGANAAWVVGDSAPYGTYIDTPKLLAGLATEVGFEAVDDVVIRSRGERWGTNGSRHQVPLTERLVVLRRP
jgi:hypothetical protein